MKTYKVDENGYYGRFGGAYIPDVLNKNIDELRGYYEKMMDEPSFQAELSDLLHNYAGRPTALYFAKRLSEKYGAKIYLKREDLNHTGAHKITNCLGQALLAKRMGKTCLIAETGAGQHGVATATVCALLGMECRIFMGKLDVERQYLNVQKMKMLGAEVVSVTSGNMTLKDAVNEALDFWCANSENTFYLIGSAIGPHPYPDMVAKFQSVISAEIKRQLKEKEGREYPDYVVACVGGGSNAIGAFYHYLEDDRVKLLVAEASGKGVDSGMTAATLHLGKEGVLHGCRTIIMLDENGEVEEPYSISAGLDYPGVGPIHAYLAKEGRTQLYTVTDDEALKSAFELTSLEGIIPALESSHALGILGKQQFKPEDLVVINLSGRGDKDMTTYIQYIN